MEEYGYVHVKSMDVGFDPVGYTVDLDLNQAEIFVRRYGKRMTAVKWITTGGFSGEVFWGLDSPDVQSFVVPLWPATSEQLEFEVTLFDPSAPVINFSEPVASVEIIPMAVGFNPTAYEVSLTENQVEIFLARNGKRPTSVKWSTPGGLSGTFEWQAEDQDQRSFVVPMWPDSDEGLNFQITLSDLSNPQAFLSEPVAAVDVVPMAVGFAPTSYTPHVSEGQVEIIVLRNGKRPASVRWTTTAGTTGLIQWQAQDDDEKSFVLQLWDETYESPNFQVTLTELDSPLAYLSAPVAAVYVIPLHVTSRPYPLVESDGLGLEVISTLHSRLVTGAADSMAASNPSIQTGELRLLLLTYTDGLPEEMNVGQPELQAGELCSILREYLDGAPEEMSLASLELRSGSLQRLLVEYLEWPPEHMQMSQPSIISGVLS